MNVDLHRAVEKGSIKDVEKHINEGADVNAIDEYDWTPLAYAAHKGYKKIAELLISKGADVEAKDGEGGTVLHIVAGAALATKGHTEIVELLINKGVDVNAKKEGDEYEYENENGEYVSLREYGYTRPLHCAAEAGNEKITELLISNGADVNIKDENGTTALHIATNNRDKKIIELLISNGADVNAKNDSDGWTPLHMAMEYNLPKVAKLLKQHGGIE
jgi:ankyrin repeat protein